MYIEENDFRDVLTDNFARYGVYVVQDRAIPNFYDGLRPVQRRVIYAMYKLGLHKSKGKLKCGKIVGETMGDYHPHGDQSIYLSLVNMAREDLNNVTLIEGEGNFGGPDDNPAASRYTEAKLSKYCDYLLKDLHVCETTKTYDGRLEEPVYLSPSFPLVLVNGSNGIGVGITCNIPMHNLGEVISACIAVIKDENISLKDLKKKILAPDFPTGGAICEVVPENKKHPYETGGGPTSGKWMVRGSLRVEGGNNIVITELPPDTTPISFIENIHKLADNGKISVSHVSNESSRNEMRIVIEVKENIEKCIRVIYENSGFRSYVNMHSNVLVDRKPIRMGLKGLLVSWVEFRRSILERRLQYDIDEIDKKIFGLSGFEIIFQDIGKALDIIVKSKKVVQDLMANFPALEKEHVENILSSPIRKISRMEVSKIKQWLKDLRASRKEISSILEDPKKIDQLMIGELEEIKSKCASSRKTIFFDDAEKFSKDFFKEDSLEVVQETNSASDEETVVFINEKKDLVRIPADIMKGFWWGGSLKKSLVDKKLTPLHVPSRKSCGDDKIVVSFSDGTCFYIDSYLIPLSDNSFVSSFKTDELFPLAEIIGIESFKKGSNSGLLLATETGIGKRIALKEILSGKSNKGKMISLKEGLSLKYAIYYDENMIKENVFAMSSHGYGYRFPLEDVLEMGKGAAGSCIFKLKDSGHSLVSLHIVSLEADILLVNENGGSVGVNIKDVKFMDSKARSGNIIEKGVFSNSFVCLSKEESKDEYARLKFLLETNGFFETGREV